jgi:hypothetical protein
MAPIHARAKCPPRKRIGLTVSEAMSGGILAVLPAPMGSLKTRRFRPGWAFLLASPRSQGVRVLSADFDVRSARLIAAPSAVCDVVALAGCVEFSAD